METCRSGSGVEQRESAGASLNVRDLRPGEEPIFRRLNEEWISRHFVLESKDESILGDPNCNILSLGGRIFLAELDGQIVGCCALLPLAGRGFEVSKMAVTQSHQRAGIGRALLRTAIEEARAAGANRLYLETNRKLIPAVRLYEAMGFRHLSPEEIVPSPYARADVYMELDLR